MYGAVQSSARRQRRSAPQRTVSAASCQSEPAAFFAVEVVTATLEGGPLRHHARHGVAAHAKERARSYLANDGAPRRVCLLHCLSFAFDGGAEEGGASIFLF